MMYTNEWDRERRILRDRLQDMKHAIKHVDHEMRHALKNSIAHDGCHYLYTGLAGNFERSGPATLDDIMAEIDGSLSYLEDLPRQKIVPYEEKLAMMGDRMVKLKESLKK